ncbi:unnamed protein product [Withania somnifera]
MKFYISATGIKKLTISSSSAVTGGRGGVGLPVGMKGKGSAPVKRRISHRTLLLPAVLVLGLLLSLLFFRITFIMLESAAFCSSPIGCLGRRIFGGSDSTLLREELMRALLEATNDGDNGIGVESSISLPSSFNDLVKNVTSNGQDIKAFAFKAKAMIMKLEQLVESARQRESIFWHLASHGVPKGIHCLSLKLAEEYAENAAALLLTDNVLAASVVVSSTIKSSSIPERLVFHIVTDKKTYAAMHAWFAVNSVNSAVLEVRGLHQYDWSHEVNLGIKEMIEIHRLICSHKLGSMRRESITNEYAHVKDLQHLRPSCTSLLNHLRIYIPELFPDLNKIVFLDDDTVVQHDLSSLWELDLNRKVIGAAFDSSCGDDCCPGRKYKDYFNFTSPIISSKLDYDHCGWLYGMNVFDLQAWRKTSITATYHHWLKLNLNSGFELWNPGALPPSLIAFEGHVHRIDPSWHIAGLGYRSMMNVTESVLADAAVVHFSGPAKPWLEIGIPGIRSLWSRHVNFSNEFISKCGIVG